MRKNLKTTLFGAICGAFLFAATAPASAGPLSAAVPQEDGGSTSLVQHAKSHHPAYGRKCLHWQRRWNSRHGYGRRRCTHWM